VQFTQINSKKITIRWNGYRIKLWMGAIWHGVLRP